VEVGAVDARGRAFDASFAALKRRLFTPDGQPTLEPGETLAASGALEVALSLVSGRREQPVLLPTWGEATTTSSRLLFLAGEIDRERQTTRLNIEFAVPPTAVDFFFRKGGREFLEIRREEVQGTSTDPKGLTADVVAAWPGPEVSRLKLRLAPRAEAEALWGQPD
jgi:hypothetical protein